MKHFIHYISVWFLTLALASCCDKEFLWADSPLPGCMFRESCSVKAVAVISESTWILAGEKTEYNRIPFFITDNKGISWYEVSSIPGEDILCLQYSNDRALATIKDSDNNFTCYLSDDSGNNWRKIYSLFSSLPPAVKLFSKDCIAISSMDAVIISNDGGHSWEEVHNDTPACIFTGFNENNVILTSDHVRKEWNTLVLLDPFNHEKDTVAMELDAHIFPNGSQDLLSWAGRRILPIYSVKEHSLYKISEIHCKESYRVRPYYVHSFRDHVYIVIGNERKPDKTGTLYASSTHGLSWTKIRRFRAGECYFSTGKEDLYYFDTDGILHVIQPISQPDN